jgi:hypothetical protein
VVGAIAPRAESSAPAPRRMAGASSAEVGFIDHDPLSFALARSCRDGDGITVRRFQSERGRSRSRPEGLGRGGKRHAREDHLRRRLRKPDRRLQSLALLVGESGTTRRLS